MTQTFTTVPIGGGETAPLIQNAYFIIEFGPTPAGGRQAFLEDMNAAMVGVVEPRGLPVPIETVAFGEESGRMIVRVFAPDPQGVVDEALAMLDEGPKVVAL